jgi:hypothetical protein
MYSTLYMYPEGTSFNLTHTYIVTHILNITPSLQLPSADTHTHTQSHKFDFKVFREGTTSILPCSILLFMYSSIAFCYLGRR